MNKVYGYLELNGNIFKITSIDELKEFVVRVGSEFKELNENQLKELCSKQEGSFFEDDCGAYYCNNGKSLTRISGEYYEYRVKEGTIAICSQAGKWYSSSSNPNNVQIKKIQMPNSVIAVGAFAFSGNMAIVDLLISSCLQYIGEKAFKGCCNLNEFEIPKTLKYIGANAFEGCDRFIKVIFGNAIKKIGSHAFKDCKNLEVVSIPSSLEIIGSGIFEGCDKLREIRIPKGTKERFSKEFPFCKDKLIECDNEIY
jgi:hypothetical protein